MPEQITSEEMAKRPHDKEWLQKIADEEDDVWLPECRETENAI